MLYLPIAIAIILLEKVVPMFAPRMIPIACLKDNTLELINTITIIITADEESKIIVATTPISIAKKVLDVYFATIPFAFSENIVFNTSDSLKMAYRNNPKPPNSSGII